MKMLIKQIGRLFERSIGLEVTTIPESVWMNFLQERMSACGIEYAEQYFGLLNSSKKEFEELLELIIVPETWFFREKEGIDFLKDHLRKMAKGAQNKVVKILSLPCSSGEEPYSIAMALLEEHFPVNSFTIDAMDISRKALAKAEKGVYGKNSFREKDLSYLDRYFDKTENGDYSLRADVRRCVHFFYGNLFDSLFAFNFPLYDIIFFRNLLIYLNPVAQKRAFSIIKRILGPNGILFVGPAEIEIAKKMQFSLIAQGSVCALMRNKESLSNVFEQMQNPFFFQLDEKTFYARDYEERKFFNEAKRLADRGHFDHAQILCLKYIQDHSTDPEGYFLMGLIQHAMGLKDEAEEYFLKTVYLNPDHHEALIYLSLLSDNKGDSNQAVLYRERAQRVQK